MPKFEAAEGQHIEYLQFTTGIFMQFLKDLKGSLVLLDFYQIFGRSIHDLTFVFFFLLHDPFKDLQELRFGSIELIFPHEIVGLLQANVYACLVYVEAFLQGFSAFRFGLFLLEKICHTDLGDTSIGLGYISFYLFLWGGDFERIGKRFLSILYSFFESLYGQNSLINFCKFKISLVSAKRVGSN